MTTSSGAIAAAQGLRTGGGLSTPRLFPGPAHGEGIASVWGLNASWVYVTDPGKNTIDVYQANMQDGSLSPAGFGPYPLTGAKGTPEQILHAGFMYVASSGGTISGFMVNGDGELSPVPGSPFAVGAPIENLAMGGGDSSTSIAYIYASEPGDPDGGIAAFAMSADGALTPVAGSPLPTVAEGGPAGLLSSDGTLYVALTNAAAVGAYTENADGTLTPVSGSPYAAGAGVASLAQAGYYLYAANSNSVSAYALTPNTGALKPMPGSPITALGADGAMVSISGDLYLPKAAASGIIGFQINGTSGALVALTTSPFSLDAVPLVVTSIQLPVIDPP